MSTRGQFNTKSPTIKRILKEASELSNNPSPEHQATPLEDNLFEWHFTLRGPPSPSPYANGIYHGRIILPPTYPLRPPSFRFLTPTGRFEVNREICLSISGHHEETWQPAWGIRTAMVAIRSFMDSEAKGQLGGMDCGEGTRRAMAGESRGWRCGGCGRSNEEILAECVEAARKKEEEGETQKKVEVVVPEELRLAYRDEIGRPPETQSQEQASPASSNILNPPSIRDPPAIDTPSTTIPAPTTDNNSTSTPLSNTSHPAQSIPQPTRTRTRIIPALPSPPPLWQLPQRFQQPQALDQVQPIPAWIDKAILGVAVSLVVMVFKKIIHI